MTKPLVILTAGGTGGHVFPAQALGQRLLEEEVDLVFMTDNRGHHYDGALGSMKKISVKASGVAGRGLIGRFRALFTLLMGTIQAFFHMRRLKPALVVGFGGYSGFPTAFAARFLKIPVILHEQNAVLGRANRVIAPKVIKLATTFKKTRFVPNDIEDKVALTGNPVRSEILKAASISYIPSEETDSFYLLITGGSQGAQIFGELVPKALESLSPSFKKRLRVVQQVRKEQVDTVCRFYERAGIEANVSPFFKDMAGHLSKAHLVICRGGASSLSELMVMGRPAIVIPYPHATDDHQTENAKNLCDGAGGWLMPQKELSHTLLCDKITTLMETPSLLEATATASKAMGHPEAVQKLSHLVIETLQKKRG